ncbi:transposase [Mesorhizobium sp. M1409]|uniref:transposase n=1 Tax=unclassified Mesorhizobium TaxID=325217 RepID=UPI00333DFD64
MLDARVRAAAKQNAIARLLMTAPCVGAVIALSVASTYDDASRFRRSSSAGAYLGLTPRRYEPGEISRNGRISKRGDQLTRTHLYEEANVILTREIGFSCLKAWGLRNAKGAGFKKRASLPSSSTPCGRRMSRSATPSLQPDMELSIPDRLQFPRCVLAGTLRG